jgi:hypothetical protein
VQHFEILPGHSDRNTTGAMLNRTHSKMSAAIDLHAVFSRFGSSISRIRKVHAMQVNINVNMFTTRVKKVFCKPQARVKSKMTPEFFDQAPDQGVDYHFGPFRLRNK